MANSSTDQHASTLFSHIEVPYLIEIVAFLLTVVILVPLFKAIKVTPIMGYLAVGALLGPFGMAVISDATNMQHFAELGIVFLLFTIGLELSFERLKAYSKMIFGLGTCHVLLCSVAIGSIAYFWGNNIKAAIVIGLCLALSSTAMVVQILTERNEISAKHGRVSFAVLLFQDLAVVPILILLTIFGSENNNNIFADVTLAIVKALAAVLLIVILGRYLMRYLFRMVAKTHSVDVFTAMTLLAILATSLLTGLAGLSLALGAFLAGLLIAETEFRHQVETEIEPFKGLLLGLFFMGVGMNLDFSAAYQNAFWIMASVFGLVLIKTLIGTLLARLFGVPIGDALRAGLMLSEAGEFAFVVIGQATTAYSIIDPVTGQFMIIVAGLSMAITPLLAMMANPLGKRIGKESDEVLRTQPNMDDVHGHVIIAGYGRVGKAVAKILAQQSVPYIALDTDPDNVRPEPGCKQPMFLGDASNTELLRNSGAASASVLLVTMDNAKAAMKTVKNVRQHWPSLPIVIRSHDQAHADELRNAGATMIVPETLEASLQLSGHVLSNCGLSREEANSYIELVRRHDYQEMHATPEKIE